MMRESVSHPVPARQSQLSACLQWCVLVGIAASTMLVGIGILIALMSPEEIRVAPTIALVCVLVLLCVPVPVLMLERRQRKVTIGVGTDLNTQPLQECSDRCQRQVVSHQSHLPHDSSPDSHRTVRATADRNRTSVSS
ncbi:MAG: hypothetical protein JKY43_01700 [Phycisphaerales bacterium]|nr:hypothetical protein [Phycisphaerales bacterium]